MADTVATSPDQAARRMSIGFINVAHALDHYVVLIFPTVVIGLEAVYGRSYAELIALGTASFVDVRHLFAAGGLARGPLEPSQHDGSVLFRLRRIIARRFTCAEPHRAGDRAGGARHVRRDLSSGRHRDADRTGDRAWPLARVQRRVRQPGRGTGGRRHRGAGIDCRLAWRVRGSGARLDRDRDRLFAPRARRPAQIGEARQDP